MKERIKKRMKYVLAVISISMVTLLTACGGDNKWVGTYGVTSSSGNKISITVNKDGTAEYKKDGDVKEGTWTENENSILLDFNGEVSSSSEPLIVTMSSDGNTITVESDNDGWNADHYQRR